MKLAGHTFDEPNKEYCVLPRPDGNDLVFISQAILDYAEFERLCPDPVPPGVIRPGKKREVNTNDPGYLRQVANKAERRIHWIVLTSLKATPELEWETVDMGDPKTWANYLEELKAAHFSAIEIQRIQSSAFIANSLVEGRVQEARENFLRGLEEEANRISSQSTEQDSTPNGQPAKGSESSPVT